MTSLEFLDWFVDRQNSVAAAGLQDCRSSSTKGRIRALVVQVVLVDRPELR